MIVTGVLPDQPTTLLLGVIALAAVGFLGLAYRSRRYWTEPGGKWFSALAIAAAVSAVLTGVIAMVEFPLPFAVEVLVNSHLLLLPVVWATFAARRIGFEWVTRWRVTAVCAFMLVIVFTRIFHNHDYLRIEDVATGLVGEVVNFLTLALITVVNISSVALIVAGIGALLVTGARYEHIDQRRNVILAISVLAVWLAPMLTFVGPGLVGSETVVTAGVIVRATMLFGISVVGFWTCLERYRLFETSAAVGGIGRDRIIETMDDAVVVVDADGRVLDVNPVAERLFAIDPGAAVGEDLAQIVGISVDPLHANRLIELNTTEGFREFEPTASPIHDPNGTLLGYSLVFRDVTERRTREQRLAVLNRVLRHNLRNEMSIIQGHADLLDEPEQQITRETAADQITETADRLIELGEKARTVEQLLSEPPVSDGETPVGEVIEDVIAAVGSNSPDCEFEIDVPEELTVSVNRWVLTPVLENVVENAVEHNDAEVPRVEVQAAPDVDQSSVVITVVDNGPGIPDHEQAVIETGNVSPLEHGSGLGLWVTKWGITRLGGTLSLATTEPRGTVVTIQFPREGPASAMVFTQGTEEPAQPARESSAD